MENINQTMGGLINRWWKLPILVFSSLILGIFFLPADSVGQAVPPRSQTLQMIRPVEPQPELPVEKQIRQNREAIEKNKRELERKIDAERTIRAQREQRVWYGEKLDRLLRYPSEDSLIKATISHHSDCAKILQSRLNTISQTYAAYRKNPYKNKKAMNQLLDNPEDYLQIDGIAEGPCKEGLQAFINYMRTLPRLIGQTGGSFLK